MSERLRRNPYFLGLDPWGGFRSLADFVIHHSCTFSEATRALEEQCFVGWSPSYVQ